jgi:hypothetical protein
MREGKKISVDIFNETNVPELVHWHGQHVGAVEDGAGGAG